MYTFDIIMHHTYETICSEVITCSLRKSPGLNLAKQNISYPNFYFQLPITLSSYVCQFQIVVHKSNIMHNIIVMSH